MYKVLVGSITPEGEHLLRTYLDKFFPDCELEPLKAAGIKGKMKNYAIRQDVILVILDETLYQACVGVADAVLALDKVHRYESDDGLKDFLNNKFGPLEDFGSTGVVPPDMLIGQEAPEDEFIPKAADLSKEDSSGVTTPPESLEKAEMVDEELPTTEASYEVSTSDAPAEVVDKLNSQISELQSQLTSKETLIRSLTMQLNDKKASDQDDIAAMTGRIRELEDLIAQKDAQINNSDQDNFVALGKVARAEQVLGEFEELRKQVAHATDECETLTKERDELNEKLSTLESEASGLREQVAQIPELQKNIESRTKQISVLEQELEVKSSTITDLEASVSEHEGVVSELEQLKSELDVLQQQITSDKEKLKELDEVKDELSKKQLEIDNLQADIRALNEKLEAQSSDIEQLRGDLQRKATELEDFQRALEECQEELNQKKAELEQCAQERDAIVSRASVAAEQLQKLNAEKTSLSEKVGVLTGQTEEQARKLTDATAQLTAKTEECESLNERLTNTSTELTRKTMECEALTSKLAEAGSELDEVRESTSTGLQEVQDKLQSKDAELTDLRNSLSEKNTTLARLTSEMSSMQEQLASKSSEIARLTDQLSDVRQQLLDAQSEGNEAAVDADTQKQALDRLLVEKGAIEDKLVAAEAKRLELEGRIKSLEEELQQERTHRGSVDDSNSELIAQNEKYFNIIKQLEDSLVKAKADDDTLKRLENDLLEERRRSARLQSEVDVMKRTRETDKASDLRIEIVRLKNELDTLRESTVDISEAEADKKALASSREYAAKLELDLVAKDKQLSEMSAGLFGQLRNIAIPRSIYDFKSVGIEGLSNKFVVVASGSEESTASVYQTLRQACASTDKNTLIVDLVTDSSIDREFGIKKVVSPLDWLEGKQSFKPFLANTRFGHVMVLSTALAYVNDLFLMTADWDRCLKELEAFSANTVVLYVGCLNNLVTKVLFDKFIKTMRGYVIVKATPINIRTTILNLAGFKKPFPPTVTVECAHFSDTSSADMYQRLVAAGYTTHILRDTEVLKL